MLIRSQNKKTIVNLNNTTELDVYPHYKDYTKEIIGYQIISSFASYDDNCSTIGIYLTEEKAIKVLDMIQQSYLNIFEILDQSIANESYWLNVKNSSHVFQMPQDKDIGE